MPTQIVMPQLGESVAEGVIGKWLKNEGDPIAKDEPIVEVVTDKVNAEIPSPVAGVLQKISAPEGATVLVGEEIAVIGDVGDGSGLSGGTTQGAAAAGEAGGTAGAGATSFSQETVSMSRSAAPMDEPGVNASTSVDELPTASAATGAADLAVDGDGSNGARRSVRSSPLVQRLAAEHNIDISRVPGTGIGGRVSKRDIVEYIESASRTPPAQGSRRDAEDGPSAPAVVMPDTPTPPSIAPVVPALPLPPATVRAAAPPPVQPAGPDEEYWPVSPVRRMIAQHMVKSKFTIPHATSMIEVDMTPAVRFRDAVKEDWKATQGISLSFMAFVALATVESLRQHPLVNSQWGEDKIIIKKRINLGLAVAAPNGLIVPNIKNADRLSLGGLAHAINDLTMRARAGKLTPDDVSGGTFTLNNTGAIGSVWSVSVINYPEAGILSADAIVKRVRVMDDDAIAIRHMMNLCMSFDHRILDGGAVSQFMQFIRQRLETWSPDGSL